MKQMFRIIGVLVAILMERATGNLVKCDNYPSQPISRAIPDLPDQFETRIEANILQKNYSMEVTEYYDYNNNRGAVVYHHQGRETRSILQFHNLERHTILANDTCVVSNLTDSRFNIFNFTTDASGGHVKGVKDILFFGKQFGETYISGDEEVRGIPVDHWQTCLKMEDRNVSFFLDYFFSKESYDMTYGSQPVPVRAIVNGTGVGFRSNSTFHSFYHVYDFFSFRPGPIRDENVFKIPVGVFCNGSVNQKDLPKLPDQFTTAVEISHVRDSLADKTTEQFYFDYPSKLLRNDYSKPISQADYDKYGNRPLSIIYDFNSSLVYISDKWNGNCTVRGVNSTLDSQDVDLHAAMRRANSLFSFMDGNYVYQGKKTWRGIPVESWADYNSSTGHFQEVFFQDPSSLAEFLPGMGPGTGGGSGPKGGAGPGQGPGAGPGQGMGPGGNMPGGPPVQEVIVGMYDRILNDAENTTITKNFFGFSPGHIEPDAYDVTRCYESGHRYSYISLKVQGSYLRASQHESEFYAAVRSAIAMGASVSSTRVTSLQVGDDGTGKAILVYFRLLDKITVKGVTVKGPGLAEAKSRLIAAIADGLSFKVQLPTIEDSYTVIQDSLWIFKSSLTTASETSSGTKYSPGSMAGLGIGMLIVGAILGLLAAYIIYKRIDTSVPYQETR